MKKLISLVLVVFLLNMGAYSDPGTVALNPAGGKGKPNCSVIPVHYDENGVIVRSDSMLYNVEVTVKDQRGAVMNRQHLDILPKTDNVISAPDSPDSEKRTIEIIVDKQKYFGYFE